MMRWAAVFLVAVGVSGLTDVVSIAATSNRDRAVAIAADLGVGVDQLLACRNEARGTVTGERGSPERRAATQTLVLACLQRARPELTVDRYSAVLAQHPAPRTQPQP